MKKLGMVAVIGFFLGMIVSHNLEVNNYDYAIIYFGNADVNGQIVPKIKLVKKLKSQHGPFFWADEGKEVKVWDIAMAAQVFEFGDADVDKVLRSRYCRENV